MQALAEMPSLDELFSLDQERSVEDQLDHAMVLRPLIVLQEWPDIALHALSGIYMPPHQRTILNTIHRGAPENVIVASRGTAKSSTVCCLYTAYSASVFEKRTSLVLSAKGFRGSQFMLLDIGRWLAGGWSSQRQEVPFFRACIPRHPDPLNKSSNYWTISYDSHSQIMALPTKDPDAIRGTRANDLFADEANIFDKELVEQVLRPMLNVVGDMRHGGAYAAKNRIFFTSTIDYSWRPFQETISASRTGLQRELHALEAARNGDFARYEELENRGLHQYTFVKFDYTDVLIRREITTRAGVRYQCDYPDTEIPLTKDRAGIPFTQRDSEGRMSVQGDPVEYWMTYAMDKGGIERTLRDGSTDEGSWKAEQRNIVDTMNGDVYGFELIQRASCEGERYIISHAKAGPEWQEHYAEGEEDYIPPVLWACADPCVLGVDYAPSSDFCAFVVIRAGPLAQGIFNPLTSQGKTDWSNVIWAEQHRKMTAREAADKIRALKKRYNLVWFHDPRVSDTWEACRAIGLDMRGGGSAIRDELCWITDEAVPENEEILYDPLDKEPRIANFAKDRRALPMLDGITASDQMNDKLVEFSKGMMEQNFLYIGKYLDESLRPSNSTELDPGYRALRLLTKQMQKLRQRPTKNWRSFYMDGDTVQDHNKKDLWSAFLYATKQLRAHVLRQRQIDSTPPPMGARVTRVNSKRGGDGNGKAVGGRY